MFDLKGNLKTGNVVKLRNGSEATIDLERGIMTLKNGLSESLSKFDDCLMVKNDFKAFRQFDVIEIWEEKEVVVKERVKLYGRK